MKMRAVLIQVCGAERLGGRGAETRVCVSSLSLSRTSAGLSMWSSGHWKMGTAQRHAPGMTPTCESGAQYLQGAVASAVISAVVSAWRGGRERRKERAGGRGRTRGAAGHAAHLS